jgi:hypothetical protein
MLCNSLLRLLQDKYLDKLLFDWRCFSYSCRIFVAFDVIMYDISQQERKSLLFFFSREHFIFGAGSSVLAEEL